MSLGTLALTLSGAQAGTGNYVLTAATYTVTATTVTVAGGGKVYNGNPQVPASTLTLSNTDGGTLGLSGTGSVTSANVGTYNATGTGAGIAGTFSIAGLNPDGRQRKRLYVAGGHVCNQPGDADGDCE